MSPTNPVPEQLLSPIRSMHERVYTLLQESKVSTSDDLLHVAGEVNEQLGQLNTHLEQVGLHRTLTLAEPNPAHERIVYRALAELLVRGDVRSAADRGETARLQVDEDGPTVPLGFEPPAIHNWSTLFRLLHTVLSGLFDRVRAVRRRIAADGHPQREQFDDVWYRVEENVGAVVDVLAAAVDAAAPVRGPKSFGDGRIVGEFDPYFANR